MKSAPTPAQIMREPRWHEHVSLDGTTLVNLPDSPAWLTGTFDFFARDRKNKIVSRRHRETAMEDAARRAIRSRRGENVYKWTTAAAASSSVLDPQGVHLDVSGEPLWIGLDPVSLLKAINQGVDPNCWQLAGMIMAPLFARPEYMPTILCVQPGTRNYSVYFRNLGGAGVAGAEYPVNAVVSPTASPDRGARPGDNGECGAQLITKAWVRTFLGGDYNNIQPGYPGAAMNLVGIATQSTWNGYESYEGGKATPLWPAVIATALMNRLPVCLTTPPSINLDKGGPDIPVAHVLLVIAIDLEARTLTLANPWGFDGQGRKADEDPADGIVTITFDSISPSRGAGGYFFFSVGRSFAVPVVPCDPNLTGNVDIQDLGMMANQYHRIATLLGILPADIQGLGIISNAFNSVIHQPTGRYLKAVGP